MWHCEYEFPRLPYEYDITLLGEKAKIILCRNNTLKGDISSVTEKDDIHPRKYGISVEVPYRMTF